VAAAGAAGVGAGATGCSCLGSAPKGSSFNGPLVALIPAAGLEAGIDGMSRGGAAGSVDEDVVGTSVDLVAPAGASVEDVWAEAALGGAGTVAPTGSGAESRNR
jgi:hypothetical protein